ncbi:MAG: XRE family transcriptional regulator [Cyanobacteria bacterium TGS_CYA1]|nr:XRE family transcriptional regulator [Cyanobacteria bacterium TGS_CYA1]
MKKKSTRYTTFDEHMSKLPPARRAKIEKEAKDLIAHELSLQEMRKSLAISQTEMAERLELNQGDISKFERREDVYVSSVRRYIEAMGGTLELIAKFPEKRRYKIKSIGELVDKGL